MVLKFWFDWKILCVKFLWRQKLFRFCWFWNFVELIIIHVWNFLFFFAWKILASIFLRWIWSSWSSMVLCVKILLIWNFSHATDLIGLKIFESLRFFAQNFPTFRNFQHLISCATKFSTLKFFEPIRFFAQNFPPLKFLTINFMCNKFFYLSKPLAQSFDIDQAGHQIMWIDRGAEFHAKIS